MGIPAKWTSGLEDKEEFESRLKEQITLFGRLFDMIDGMEKANYNDRMKKGHYEKKAWSEFQADATGYARALSEIKFLLKFTKEQHS